MLRGLAAAAGVWWPPPPARWMEAGVGGAAAIVASDRLAEAATARSRPDGERPPTTRSVLLLARLLFQSAASFGGRASGARRVTLKGEQLKAVEVFTRQSENAVQRTPSKDVDQR